MNLFEIDQRLEHFFDEAQVDETTGEVIYDEAELDALQMTQTEKRKNIALLIKNLDSDVADLKAQEDVFAKRRKTKESRRDWLKAYLMRSLNGEDFECAEVAVKHRLNPIKVDFDKTMEPEIISWMKKHKLGRFIKKEVKESIIKSEVKAYMMAAADSFAAARKTDIPGVSLIRETTLTIK